jgi:CheY-like chemotaxis protein
MSKLREFRGLRRRVALVLERQRPDGMARAGYILIKGEAGDEMAAIVPREILVTETVGSDAPSLHVVVVEDVPILREALAECLETQGFTVARAANGVEAMLQIRRLRPATVVLDLLLPRQDGFETLREIRAFDASIRVVIVTGASDAAIHTQVRALGATAVLRKPIMPETLIAAVRGQGSA